ncbi:MAG: DUF58 domain-containing protein [Planctomycetaceae bacterium]|jgi:uncharacterized protein (DUF58 family)|nr:DUF58 domain-containing protein [Planctomycetaceae bacterium]
MTTENYFNPEVLRRISRLDLRARNVVEGFLSGMHKSRHFGNSVEFRQHRQYVAGDDPKNVDWKVWAKQDRLYVKQYEVDTNLRLTLLLDMSPSMRYGSRRDGMTKYDYAATLAASIGYLAIRQQDAVGCITFNKDAESMLQPRMKQSQLDALVQTMERSDPAAQQLPQRENRELLELTEVLQNVKESQPTMKDALREAAEVTTKFGIVVLISDLLVQRGGLFAGLRYLRGRGQDLIVLHVLDDEELDFNLGGPTRFEGLELPLNLRCDPRMLRKGYIEALQEYLEEIRRGCSHHQADYTLFRTSEPIDAALSTYLNHRHSILKGAAQKIKR